MLTPLLHVQAHELFHQHIQLLLLLLLLKFLLLQHLHRLLLQSHPRILADGGIHWKIQVPALAPRRGQACLRSFHIWGRGLELVMAPPTKLSRYTSPAVAIKEITAHNITGMGTFLMKHKVISVTEHLLTISACQYCGIGRGP